MKKLYSASLLSLALGLLMINYSTAQSINSNSEVAPTVPASPSNGSNATTAIFDIQFSFDPDVAAGTASSVGTLNTGTEIWISVWNTNVINIYDYAGTFIAPFTVTGVTGTRAMTTDGTAAYFALNTSQLKKVDLTTHAVLATITMPALTGSANTTVRWATYDPTLNSGAGGFWIGNYDTDILSVDMTGALLPGSIPAGNHGLTAMYGGAVDNLTPGGPFLWINNQLDPPTASATGAFLTQLDITNQVQTGLVHDMEPDFGTLGGIGGGISITTLPGFTQPCIFANDQGIQTAAYELIPLGIKKIDVPNSFKLAPNPASKNGSLKIAYKPLQKENLTLTITDLSGKIIYTEEFKGVDGINKSIPVTNAAGMYTVTIVNE
ncbi:MAG: T9SS type A sorting domain-containing protein, partial [Bacteroidota bacterium]